MSVNPDSIVYKPLYNEQMIHERVSALGQQISLDYRGESIVVISILKGAFIFTADLVRALSVPTTLEFMGVSSYQGTSSTGNVRITHDLSADIRGKNVIVVEDIVDTGRTLDYLLRILAQRNPKSLKLCTLLSKPAAREVEVKVDYCGFEIENLFVIGYGLDLDQRYRELPFIAQVQA